MPQMIVIILCSSLSNSMPAIRYGRVYNSPNMPINPDTVIAMYAE